MINDPRNGGLKMIDLCSFKVTVYVKNGKFTICMFPWNLLIPKKKFEKRANIRQENGMTIFHRK